MRRIISEQSFVCLSLLTKSIYRYSFFDLIFFPTVNDSADALAQQSKHATAYSDAFLSYISPFIVWAVPLTAAYCPHRTAVLNWCDCIYQRSCWWASVLNNWNEPTTTQTLCDGQSKGRSREHQTFTINNDIRRVDPSNAGNDEIVDCQPS